MKMREAEYIERNAGRYAGDRTDRQERPMCVGERQTDSKEVASHYRTLKEDNNFEHGRRRALGGGSDEESHGASDGDKWNRNTALGKGVSDSPKANNKPDPLSDDFIKKYAEEFSDAVRDELLYKPIDEKVSMLAERQIRLAFPSISSRLSGGIGTGAGFAAATLIGVIAEPYRAAAEKIVEDVNKAQRDYKYIAGEIISHAVRKEWRHYIDTARQHLEAAAKRFEKLD